MGTALVDAIESARRVVSDLLPGWTSVDFLMMAFGLCLIVVFSMVFNAMFPGRKAVYKGEKDKRGRPHGRGRLQNINGDVYEGDFSQGKPHGLGLYTFRKNNCTYQGAFRAGLYHGQGVETYENGSKFEGEFEAGIRHGTGKMTFQDGSWYYGDWRKGRRHGKGTHFDKIEQSRYAGEFQSGLRHGRGSLYVRHGEKKVGVWERGQMLRERSVEASQGAGASSPSSELQSAEFRDADANVEAQMRESAARIGRMETDAARAAAAARGLADTM